MGAAVEINTGAIGPEHLAGRHVMLGSTDLGVLDGTQQEVRFEIPSGKHILYFKEGLTTSGAVGFLVQTGHCARITVKDGDAGMFAPIFGGWFSLERAGDERLADEDEGATELPVDEVPAEA